MQKTPLMIRCYSLATHEEIMIKVEGESVGGLFPGFNFFIHPDPLDPDRWNISEEKSGIAVAGASSKDFAIKKAKEILRTNRDRFPSIVNEAIERNKQLFPQLNP